MLSGHIHAAPGRVGGVGIVVVDCAVPCDDDIIADRDLIAGDQLCATSDVYAVAHGNGSCLCLKDEGGVDDTAIADRQVCLPGLWCAQIKVEIVTEHRVR